MRRAPAGSPRPRLARHRTEAKWLDIAVFQDRWRVKYVLAQGILDLKNPE